MVWTQYGHCKIERYKLHISKHHLFCYQMGIRQIYWVHIGYYLNIMLWSTHAKIHVYEISAPNKLFLEVAHVGWLMQLSTPLSP